jgi:ferritin-like protein
MASEADQQRPASGDGCGVSRVYTYAGDTFATEREMIVRFLDDFRAAESFGATVIGLWEEVARNPVIRGGLRTIRAREQRHANLLADRLRELGAECRAELGRGLRDAARARLASAKVSDLEKLEEVSARLADVDVAVKPIRAVLAQIEDDLETRELLRTILDEEIATLRWMGRTRETLQGRRA